MEDLISGSVCTFSKYEAMEASHAAEEISC